MRKITLLSVALLLSILDSRAQEIFQLGQEMHDAIPVQRIPEGNARISASSVQGPALRASAGSPTGSSAEVGITPGKLDVTLSGGASYTIPFATPPGINGVAPSVNLTYNSQGGNGIAGYGWNIAGISTITRIPRTKHHDDVVGGVNYNIMDRFALDGQRLILKSSSPADYGTNGSVYETESFSNLRITGYGYGPAYFVIEYPDGSIAHYGNSVSSKTTNEWSLTYWQNPQGLRINYEYINAYNDLSIWKISYGARLAETPPNRIEFVYKQRLRKESTYSDELALIKQNTLDEVKIYGNSALYRSYKLSHTATGLGYERLSSIKESSGDGKSLNPTVFSYGEEINDANYNSFATTISMRNINMKNTASVSGDFNGDGKTDFILYPITGTEAKSKYWVFNDLDSESNNVGFEVNNGAFQDIFPVSFLAGSASYGHKLMQSQGWAVVKDGASTLEISTYCLGTASPYYYQYSRSIPQSSIQSNGTRTNYSGDFNGDGITDILTIKGKKAYLINLDPRIDSGYVIDLGSLPVSINATDRVFVADFNGDGKSDIYIFGAQSLFVYGVDSQNSLTRIATASYGTSSNPVTILMGDYNGDGKADFLIPAGYNSSAYSLYSSNGKSLSFTSGSFVKTTGNFSFNYLESVEVGTCVRAYHLIPSDFNGDGKTDLLYVSNYCNGNKMSSIDVHYFANTSAGFQLKATAQSQPRSTIGQDNEPVLPVAVSFNIANGASEINFLSDRYIHRFQSVKSHLEAVRLKEITAGNGFKQVISYAPLLEEYENPFTTPYMPSPLPENYPYYDIKADANFMVVRMLEEISSTDYKKQTYGYYGATASVDGVGFLGFKAVKRSNWHNDSHPIISTVTKYDISKKGALSETFTALGDYQATHSAPSNYITKSSYTNDLEIMGNKVSKLRNLAKITHDKLLDVTEESNISYDEFLNPIFITEVTKRSNVVDQTKTTNVTYDNLNNSTSYIIGRMTGKDVSVTHDGDNTTSQELYVYNSVHLLEQSKVKGHNTGYVTEDNIYDAYGNLKQKTVSAPDSAPRTAKFEYDNSGRFLKKSIDIEGLESSFIFNPISGTLMTETDPYGRVTQYVYDSWFRTIKTIDYLNKSFLYGYSKPDQRSSQVTVSGDDGSSSLVKYDDLGREVISGSKNLTGAWSYVMTSYDIYGRAVSIGEPISQLSGTPTQVTTTSFDSYGRTTAINSFTGQVTTMQYDGLTLTVDDGIKVTNTARNAIGNTVSLTENGGSTLQYKYFANGNLQKTIFEGVETLMEQDGWGRKTKLIDNSAGIYQYEYNGFSDLTKEITPKGTTTYVLDDFGKLIEKTVVGDLTNSKTTFSYDSQSKLPTSSRFDDFIEGGYSIHDYIYDSYKRLSLMGESNSLAYYQRAIQYDDFGRPDRELYTAILTANGQRSDKWIKKQYKNGYLSQLLDGGNNQVLWQINAVNTRGQVTNASYGGLRDTKVNYSYDSYGFASKIDYSRSGYQPKDQPYVPAIDFMTLDYAFNPVTGNLNSRTNSSFNWNEAFTYDNFNRLKTFTNGKGANEEQVYDSKGRIQSNGAGEFTYHPQKVYQNTSIEMTEEAKAYYTNREGIFNDSMEEQKGWTTYWNPTAITYDNINAHTGNYAIKMVNPTASEIMAVSETRIPINNLVDTEYTYSAWVVGTGGQAEMFLYMGTQNTLGSYDNADNITYNPIGEWVKIEKTILVPASVKYLSIRLDNNGGGTMWFDDVRIKKTGNTTTSLRELNIKYNAFKGPVEIEETGVEKISYIYNSANQRSSMFYGGLQNDKMQRPARKHYSLDGSMEIKHNVLTGAVEFLTYIGGDAYTAPLVLKSNGTSQEYLRLFRDYQGTILGVANSSDVLLEKRLFDAWGNIISVMDGQGNKLAGLTVLDRGYTGHEHLESVGLIHMNGRLYDPRLHRFLQPDNNIQDINDTQNFNRYSYVLNNPLRYVDPSGETSQDCIECGGQSHGNDFQIGFGGSIHSLIMNWDEIGMKDWSNQNWDSFKKDWKSGTGYISDQLKSANGWIDQNLRSFEKDWKKFWGKSDPETRKLSVPQFSDFQATNGWQNQGFKTSDYQPYRGEISMPTQHHFLGINMTALSKGNFLERMGYEAANTINIPIQYLMFRSVNDGSMRNLNGTSTTTDEAVMAFGTTAINLTGGSGASSGGKTFAQYKASRGGTETLGFIQTSTGVQRISTEFSHTFISQRMQRAYNLPNWLVNNSLNVHKLNTIQHSLIDSFRFNFLRKGIKPDVGWFKKYNWFTKFN